MIVDDSPVVTRLIKSVLEEYGYENIRTAAKADDAIRLLEETLPDMILLDYQMPEKNGEVVLDLVKEKYPDTIVIMLSGQQDRDIVVRLMRKADNYIIKDNLAQVKEELLNAIKQSFDIQTLREENKKLMDKISERNDRLEKQLAIARTLLKGLFPKTIEKSSVFDVQIYNCTWDIIGGDYYNITRLDNHNLGIYLGDICGHGIEAAMLLFTLSNSFKEAVKSGGSGIDILKELNSILRKRFPAGSFVTCSYLSLDDENSKITITSASDTPILQLRKNGAIEEITHGELSCLGLVDLTHEAHKNRKLIDEKVIELAPEEKLFIFTDGIVEARNNERKMFGLERVKKIVEETRTKNTSDTISAISDAVRDFSHNKMSDDITIIGIAKK